MPLQSMRLSPLLNALLILILTCLWLLLGARPALANPIPTDNVNYSHANLIGQDFSNSPLSGRSFVAANMKEANFSGSDLTNAMLTQGNFTNANLQNADFTGALLDQADLSGADLSNAILQDATLTRSTLRHTNVTGADFTDAIVDRYEITRLCRDATGTNPKTGVETRESLGCR